MPTGNFDALGMLTETITKPPSFVKPVMLCDGNGGFQSFPKFTEWHLGYSQRNGYIVQHVSIKRMRETCDGDDNWIDPAPEDYYEAWHVVGGKVYRWPDPWSEDVYPYDDLFQSLSWYEECGFQGMVQIRYEAGFYEGSLSTGNGGFTRGGGSWGDALYGTTLQPSFWAGMTKETSKAIGYTFRCCCSRKRTLMWSVGESSSALVESDNKPCSK
jgi:hypothetical protein